MLKMRTPISRAFALALLVICSWFRQAPAQDSKPAGGYAVWSNGPSDSADYFPIGVWLQEPVNARSYKNLGINLYVGLDEGPTESQVATLEKVGMPVICAQNDFALRNMDRKIIVGWLQQDEPDNSQGIVGLGRYSAPIPPVAVHATYDAMRKADPSRPIYIGLGQGVAWDGWIGRGTHTNKPEDYLQYVKCGDILSFDIYPAASTRKETAGKLWMVPFGVDRLRKWSDDQKFVWNSIETTRINNPDAKVTPQQVASEVWMSIIHGSRGIVYFAHQFKPKFVEAGLLADSEMAMAVSNIDAQIKALAPILNSPTIKDGATVASSAGDVPVDIMVKQYGGATYVMAVAMRDGQTQAKFIVPGLKGSATVSVLGEDREIMGQDGRWEDSFVGFGVHLYRVSEQR